MSRRLKILLAVCLTIGALVAVAVWSLPEIVRRVLVARIPGVTGRETRIEDLDLNLFTGRFAVTKLWMARRPGHGPLAFVEFDRLDGRIAPLALLRREIRVRDLRLSRPAVRITRTGPLEFDVSDLLAVFVRPTEKQEPSGWIVTLDRLDVADGEIVLDDPYVSPAESWRLEGLAVQASGLSTRPGQAPGRLRLGARLGDAKLTAVSDALSLAPFNLAADLSLSGFDLARARPYLPAGAAAVPREGVLSLAVKVHRAQAGEALTAAKLSGDVHLAKLALVQRGRDAPFLAVDRLDVVIKETDFLARKVLLDSVEMDGLDLKATRDAAGRIDLLTAQEEPSPTATGGTDAPADGSPPAPAPVPAGAPTSRGPPVRIERLTVKSGTITVTDEAVDPGRRWTIAGLSVEAHALSTSPEDAPGTLKLRGDLLAQPGAARPSAVLVDADSVRLFPAVAASARVSLERFALDAVAPYWPEGLPAGTRGGTLGFSGSIRVETGAAGRLGAVASGTARLEDLVLIQAGRSAPFLKLPRLTVGLKRADLENRTVAIDALEIEGADVRAVRDARGDIDLLGLASASAAGPVRAEVAPAAKPAAEAPPVSATATAPWRVTLDRLAFRKGHLTFEDRMVSPVTTAELSEIKLDAERLNWPFTKPATFALLVLMPGGGWTYGKGTAVLEPLNVQVSLSTRDTPIEPWQPYLPFPARLRGQLNGDSLSEVQRGPKGELVLASRGTAWANLIQVLAPGAEAPTVRVDSVVIQGIDFSWPNYALVQRVVVARPEVDVERDPDGRINLRALFETPKGDQAPARETPTASADAPAATGPSGPETAGTGQKIVMDFGDIRIVNGRARFVDRAITPPFSEDVTRISLRIQNLSNVLGRPERTSLTLQALVGVDGALAMKSNVSGIGETLRGDLVAELRDFSLPSANPYTDSMTSWVVQRGTLQAKIHYTIEGDQITAEHDLAIKNLQVEKTGEGDVAQRRIGVPLGLAVALLKDSHGNIDLTIPLTGTLSDQRFNWGDAMWAAVKQVIGKLVLSPFRAIGRLVTGGGEDGAEKLAVDPVTFPPASAVIAPSLEAQLTKVAEFLRRSPQVKLALAPVVTAADVEGLKRRQARARLEAFRRDQSLPDFAAALAQYYKQLLPEVPLPPTVPEQLAELAKRETVSDEALAELARRRLEAVRDDLVKAREIPAERLEARAAAATAVAAAEATGEGRVELSIVPAQG